MKSLTSMVWAMALAWLLAGAGKAQDKDGVVGHEVRSTSTPGGGGELEPQGVTGQQTPWFIVHAAPAGPGVMNVVITYYDSQESRDKAKEKEKDKKDKDKKGKDKEKDKKGEAPAVPTYDPRFYDYKDGKLVPKTPTYDPRFYEYKDGKLVRKAQTPEKSTPLYDYSSATNSGSLTANGGNGGHSDTTYDNKGNPQTPTYDPRFYEYKDEKLVPKAQSSSGAGEAVGNRPASVQGLVVPDSVGDRQPFSFAVPQNSGEVVDVESAAGVVVRHSIADRFGRVFVPAGLPAGAYLISAGNDSRPVGQIDVSQISAGAAREAGRPTLMRVEDIISIPNRGAVNPATRVAGLPAVKLSDPFSLSGSGFSPNFADMQVNLSSAAGTQTPVVLAATEDQLKLAPVPQMPAGAAQLAVTNRSTGQSAAPRDLFLYDMQGRLMRTKVHSGEQTQLIVNVRPENNPLPVHAQVISGPVDFGGGRREAELSTSNGQAVFPIYAEHGAGPFQINWSIAWPSPCPDESAPVDGQDKATLESDAATEETNAAMERLKGNYGQADDQADKDKGTAAYHDRVAEEKHAKAGEPGKAAESAAHAASDYENAASLAKKPGDEKKLRDKAAAYEQQAAEYYKAQAQKDVDPCDGKSKDYKDAAKQLQAAADAYKRAADDYRKNNNHQAAKDMDAKAAELKAGADSYAKK